MSITKDFESLKSHTGVPGYYYYDVPLTEQLLAHARALEAMLRKHEWIMDDHMGNGYCPECGSKMNGHAPDCQLAKLLEGV